MITVLLQNPDKIQYDNIIELLCDELMNLENSQDIAKSFPDILLLLLSTAIPPDNSSIEKAESPTDIHRLNCAVLGKLVNEHPDVLG